MTADTTKTNAADTLLQRSNFLFSIISCSKLYNRAKIERYKYEEETEEEAATPEPSAQRLTVTIDRRNRRGKQVTLVSGFIGREEDLAELGRKLKVRCGVGGSAKNGEITVQGDFRDKVTALLNEMGYKAKRGN